MGSTSPSDEDIEEFKNALEEMDDVDIFNQAHEAYNQGQMRKAFLYFHYTAMKETAFRVYRADALYYLAYILQQTEPDRALKYLDLSVELDESCADTFNLRGMILELSMDVYEDALRDYTKAISLGSEVLHIYHHNRGQLYELHLEKYEEALRDYEKAIEFKSDFSEGYNSRGVLYERHFQRPFEALNDYNRAIKYGENDEEMSIYYYNRGTLYEDHYKNYDEALSDYTKSIELNSSHPDVHLRRAFLCERVFHNVTQALEDYTKVLELDPTNVETFINRAELFEIHVHDFAKALQDYNSAINLDSNYPKLYNNRGFLYAHHFGDFEKALQDFDTAHNLDKQYPYPLGHKAHVLYMQNHLPEAKAIALECLAIDEKVSRAHYVIGMISFKDNELEACIHHLTRFLQLGHSNKEFYESAKKEISTVIGDISRQDQNLVNAMASELKSFLDSRTT